MAEQENPFKRIQIRRDPLSLWQTHNPVLRPGEYGLDETATQFGKIKVGDGVTPWNSLPYLSDEGFFFFDSRNGGEEFRFYLPVRMQLYRGDYTGSLSTWLIRAGNENYRQVATLAQDTVLAPGVYTVKNNGLQREALTLMLTPMVRALPEPGMFSIPSLPMTDVDSWNEYVDQLSELHEQENSFAVGDFLGHNGTSFVLATNTIRILGIVEQAQPEMFKIVYNGAVRGLPGVTAGTLWGRGDNGKLTPALDESDVLIEAIDDQTALFLPGGRTGGETGGSTKYKKQVFSNLSGTPDENGMVVQTFELNEIPVSGSEVSVFDQRGWKVMDVSGSGRTYTVTYKAADTERLTFLYFKSLSVASDLGIDGERGLVPFLDGQRNLEVDSRLFFTPGTAAFETPKLTVKDHITEKAKYTQHLRGKRYLTTRGAWNGLNPARNFLSPAITRSGNKYYFGGRHSSGVWVYDTATKTGSRINWEYGPANGIKLFTKAQYDNETTAFTERAVFGIIVTTTDIWVSIHRSAGHDMPLWRWNLTTDTGSNVYAGAGGSGGSTANGGTMCLLNGVIYQSSSAGLIAYTISTNSRYVVGSAGNPVNGDAPFAGLAFAELYNGRIYCSSNSNSGIWIYDPATNTGRRITTSTSLNGQTLHSNAVVSVTVDAARGAVYFGTDGAGVWKLTVATDTGYRYTTTSGVSEGNNCPGGWIHLGSAFGSEVYFACTGGGGIWVLNPVTNAGRRILTTTALIGEKLPWNTPEGVHMSSLGLWATQRGSGIWEYATGSVDPYANDDIPQTEYVKSLVNASAFTEQKVRNTLMTGFNPSLTGTPSETDKLIEIISKQQRQIDELKTFVGMP